MRINPDNIHLCSTAKVDRRATEVRILLNVIQPNPVWQPLLITDEATLDGTQTWTLRWSGPDWSSISAYRCLFRSPLDCGSWLMPLTGW
jgi:hypothetical protein